jgi:putative ABC transport system ATP-binding protein
MGDLRFENVSRKHVRATHEVLSLNDVSLEIPGGSYVTITGPSGSGKSTMLQLLGLLDQPTSGQVLVDGRPTSTISDDERAVRRRTTFGFVFQSFQLMPGLNAWENVALPMMLDGKKLRSLRERAETLLAEVGLVDRREHRPADLSGGEQQRIALARALMVGPQVVLADEPTGALDRSTSGAVIELLERLTVRAGRTLILVTHDPGIANRPGARRVGLRDGKIAFDHHPDHQPDRQPDPHDRQPDAQLGQLANLDRATASYSAKIA